MLRSPADYAAGSSLRPRAGRGPATRTGPPRAAAGAAALAARAARTLSLAPLGLARPSLAADATERLRAGYDGIEALLKNWDKETFIKCGQEGQVTLAAECDRDANKVPAALGLKSTDAPLFKVEKLFKAAITPDVDIDAWNLATEQFVQHSTSAQEYAYTASFGEYNPSGGKDQVAAGTAPVQGRVARALPGTRGRTSLNRSAACE